MLRDGDRLVFSGCCRLCLDLGLIEQADLIRRELLAAGGIAPCQCEVQLFLESQCSCGKLFVLLNNGLFIGLQLFIASTGPANTTDTPFGNWIHHSLPTAT